MNVTCIAEVVEVMSTFVYFILRPAAWPSSTGSNLVHMSSMTLKAATRMYLFHGHAVHIHMQGTVIKTMLDPQVKLK